MDKDAKFESDFRVKNPALHMLYTKTAVKHLIAIDETIKMFCEMANGNLLGVIDSLQIERMTLVNVNAAYAEANEILEMINKVK